MSVLTADDDISPPQGRPGAPLGLTGEKVKLVIWDLDETFWRGTLEEGGVELVPAHVEMVRTLSLRGIVNSIASKNHRSRARAVLEQAGLWEYFVLPQIAFLPKGELVRSVIELCQLRAPSVLFIDDNIINLNEVAHYNPGIQVALPDVLDTLLDNPRCQGAPDPQLTRLRNYQILGKREADRAQHASDNSEFLRQSEIRISIHHDVIAEFARIHELVNRTNQLNFTKKRLPDDIGQARAEMHAALTQEYNCHAAYIKVADKYGYYGICGFYMMRHYAAEHLLFSCRILNMGVEQLIYQKIGRPALPRHADVVSDPAAPIEADWITIVDDAETATAAAAAPSLGVICMRGACDLSQSAHYLRERFTVTEEFPYPNGSWGIGAPLTDYVALRDAFADPANAAAFDWPWFDPAVLLSRVYDRSADIYLLSFGQEPFVNRFRHKPTGLILPINLGPFNTADLTTLPYEQAATCDLRMTEPQWARMQQEFEFMWRFNPEYFERNLLRLLDLVEGKRVIVPLSNTRFGAFTAINEVNAQVNEVVRHAARGRDITLIELDGIIENDDEMVEMNHFRRDVYMRLAQAIAAELATLPPAAPGATPSPAAPPDTPAPAGPLNLLPAHRTMHGDGWQAINGAQTLPSPLPPRQAGASVLRHTLTAANSYANFTSFGCLLLNQVTPGACYTAAAWVWIPAGFRGAEVSLCCVGRSSLQVTRAALNLREAWQQVSVTVQIPPGEHNLLPALNILGQAGDEIHSTCWTLHTAIPAA
jgi:FkbH-like protein